MPEAIRPTRPGIREIDEENEDIKKLYGTYLVSIRRKSDVTGVQYIEHRSIRARTKRFSRIFQVMLHGESMQVGKSFSRIS